MRADSLSLTEEVSQFSTSTSSVVFPQQKVGERDSVLSVSSGMYRERLDSKEGLNSLQWLKFISSFISQDEGMSESPVETLEKDVGLRLKWTGVSHPFDTTRGTRNSMLQKVTMPYSS